jgi:hypothetical protein
MNLNGAGIGMSFLLGKLHQRKNLENVEIKTKKRKRKRKNSRALIFINGD